MSAEQFDSRVRQHIEEFQHIIKEQFPEATFKTYPGQLPHHFFIKAYTDVDDEFEVLDLVGDQIIDILVDEGIRIHVIPMGSNHH